MEQQTFWDFIRTGDYRFYQERDLGLDLYHLGLPGILLVILGIASALLFLLAIFHIIPARRHVVTLLLGAGLLALLVGLGTTYHSFRRLPEVEARIIRETAGPRPASPRQRAAVVALPLLAGTATLAASCLGCLYMGIFWMGGTGGRGRSKE